jgi:hypothetical protein
MNSDPELHLIQRAAYHFLPKGSFVAGGALTSAFTGTPINDVDLYFKSQVAFEEAVHAAYDENLWCVDMSKRAVTFARDNCIVQMMHFDWFSDAPAIFEAFDFTCCMGAYDVDAEAFVFDDRFLKHASQRHLSFHSGTRFPFGSLLRVLKYQKRGYTIGKSDLIRIALCCHETQLESWEDLSEAVGGQYGEKIALQADGDFSIDAALKAIEATDFTISSASRATMPRNSDALLAQIFVPIAKAA